MRGRIIKTFVKDILQNSVANSNFTPPLVRNFIYSLYGHKCCGTINAGAFLGFGKGKLILGKGSSVNYNCFFDLGDDVVIGKNVNISYNVTFVNSSHLIGDSSRRASDNIANPIIVEDGCWIGANVIILPGVRICRGCVIGSGAVVTANCEPNGLYVGNPAKRIRELLS